MVTKGIKELSAITTGKKIYVQVNNGYFVNVTKASLLKTARSILKYENQVVTEYEIAFYIVRIIFK